MSDTLSSKEDGTGIFEVATSLLLRDEAGLVLLLNSYLYCECIADELGKYAVQSRSCGSNNSVITLECSAKGKAPTCYRCHENTEKDTRQSKVEVPRLYAEDAAADSQRPADSGGHRQIHPTRAAWPQRHSLELL